MISIFPLEIIIIILTLVTAFIAAEARDTLHAIIAFLVMSILIAVIFVISGAYYAAFFQLLVYAGAVVVLLLITLHTVRRRVKTQ